MTKATDDHNADNDDDDVYIVVCTVIFYAKRSPRQKLCCMDGDA